ncbi:hypothetical protein SDC9_72229 [bioreactor metagenome]|uniref:Uncharacterized protein n=1 Tax=bioreactor metagenome TaxID=1076179 RepID=A0A644YBR0_9ZZZZ
MAHQGPYKVDELLGNAAGVHQLAGHDEEGDAGQTADIDAGKDLLGEDVEIGVHAHAGHMGQTGDAQNKYDGRADHQQDKKCQYNDNHALAPPSPVSDRPFFSAE